MIRLCKRTRNAGSLNMGRSPLALALSSLLLLSPQPSAGAPPPKGTVCAYMEQLGQQLRTGDSAKFFFVDGLDGNFPVPAFMKAVRPHSSSIDIRLEMLYRHDSLPKRALPHTTAMRVALNRCGWQMSLAFGRREHFAAYTGGVGKTAASATHAYSLGGMRLWQSRSRLGSTVLYTVFALTDQSFAQISTTSVDRAYWLIRLFRTVQDQRAHGDTGAAIGN